MVNNQLHNSMCITVLFLVSETIWKFSDMGSFEWIFHYVEVDLYAQDGAGVNGYSRYGHTCTCTRNATLICHAGGTYLGQFTNDTYVFDPETNYFSQVDSHPDMNPRYRHAVVYVERLYPDTDLLFMYGGSNLTEYFNDLWVMNTNVQGKKSKKTDQMTNWRSLVPIISTSSTSSNSDSVTSSSDTWVM